MSVPLGVSSSFGTMWSTTASMNSNFGRLEIGVAGSLRRDAAGLWLAQGFAPSPAWPATGLPRRPRCRRRSGNRGERPSNRVCRRTWVSSPVLAFSGCHPRRSQATFIGTITSQEPGVPRMMASLAMLTAKTRPIKGRAFQWLRNGVGQWGGATRARIRGQPPTTLHANGDRQRLPSSQRIIGGEISRWLGREISLRTSPAIRPAP